MVGPVAHGGHCVARLPEPESRVVFVRHALPGERVVVEVTEGTDGDRFWRGDAVSVLEASPDRVPAPCPVAGPGLCGGCDFQHVAVPAQRDLKTAVVREQLVRLGRLDAGSDLVAACTSRASRSPGVPTTACGGAPASATPPSRTARRRCARTARTTWSPSTTA